MRLAPDGSRIIVELVPVAVETEVRERVRESGVRFVQGLLRESKMCQQYEIRQPEKRSIMIYECSYYVGEKGWGGARIALMVAGVLGCLVLLVGALAAVLPPVAWALRITSPGNVIGVGGAMVTLGLGGAALVPMGDRYDDYQKRATPRKWRGA